jgi:hypothetical protein
MVAVFVLAGDCTNAGLQRFLVILNHSVVQYDREAP